MLCFTLITSITACCHFSVTNMDIGYQYKKQEQQLSEQQKTPFFRCWFCRDSNREQLLQKSFFKKRVLAVDLHAPTSEAVAGYL